MCMPSRVQIMNRLYAHNEWGGGVVNNKFGSSGEDSCSMFNRGVIPNVRRFSAGGGISRTPNAVGDGDPSFRLKTGSAQDDL